jgi:DNA-binding response OmpR family regulator
MALSSSWAAAPGTVVLVGGSSPSRGAHADAFRQEGWRAAEAATSRDALAAVQEAAPSVVVLIDESLEQPLFETLTQLRGFAPDARYVLLVDQLDPMADSVGPAVGAADIVNITVPPRDLLSRVAALARDNQPPATQYGFGNVVVDSAKARVFCGGAEVSLSPARWNILLDLVSHPMVIRPFEELYEIALQRVPTVDRRHLVHTVTEHIRNVRIVVEPIPHRPRWIKSVRKVGYMFNPGVPT